MIKYQFFPRSHGLTEEMRQIIERASEFPAQRWLVRDSA